MADEMTVSERLIYLSGALDAYAAGQGVRLDDIDRTLARHEVVLDNLRDASGNNWSAMQIVLVAAGVIIAGGGGVLSLVQAIAGG
jgi:hypothetical protein